MKTKWYTKLKNQLQIGALLVPYILDSNNTPWFCLDALKETLKKKSSQILQMLPIQPFNSEQFVFKVAPSSPFLQANLPPHAQTQGRNKTFVSYGLLIIILSLYYPVVQQRASFVSTIAHPQIVHTQTQSDASEQYNLQVDSQATSNENESQIQQQQKLTRLASQANLGSKYEPTKKIGRPATKPLSMLSTKQQMVVEHDYLKQLQVLAEQRNGTSLLDLLLVISKTPDGADYLYKVFSYNIFYY